MLWIYDNVSSTVNRDTLATDPAAAAESATKTIIFTITAPSPEYGGGDTGCKIRPITTINGCLWARIITQFVTLRYITTSAVKRSIGSTIGFHNHGQGPY